MLNVLSCPPPPVPRALCASDLIAPVSTRRMLARVCSITSLGPGDRVRRGVPSVRAKYPQRRRTWLEPSADWTGENTSGELLRMWPAQEAPFDLSELAP